MTHQISPRDVSCRWRQWTAHCLGWATSIVTVAALGAIGWYGHATHWTFTPRGHGGSHREIERQDDPADDGDRDTVHFNSVETVARSGIKVVAVEERPMVSELHVSGLVSYDERRVAQLSTRVSGSVWKVEKHLGDEVRKDDVLVIVESNEVGTRKAEFLNALVSYEARREQLAILEEARAAVMGRQLREARSALRESRNHLMNAEQALVNLGFDITVADFEPLDDDARAARIRTLGLAPAAIAGIDPSRVTSNLIPLRAPFDGIVIGREAVVGEIVEAGRQIFEVADVSRMWVVLSVNKEDAARVALGQPVCFRPDGTDREFASAVSWISTEVDDETRTLEVRAEIEAAERDLLRANTFGSGQIEVARLGTALVVPSESVQWDGRRWVVFEPTGEATFTARPVTPGLREGDRIEIRGEFAGAPPRLVVSEGSHLLKSKILLDRMEQGEM